MEAAFDAISKAPLASILVLAGLFFWLLAVAGSLAGKITVKPQQQKIAAILGTVLLVVGLALNFFVPAPNLSSRPATPSEPAASSENVDGACGRPRGRERPSFNCANAQEPIEHLICADADLAYWDGEMGRLYHGQLDQQKTPEAKRDLNKQQNDWQRRRDDQCDIPDAGDFPPAKLCGKKECILSQIKARVGELEPP
jgi:uncharacterized protein YecT (DUF1311 family)